MKKLLLLSKDRLMDNLFKSVCLSFCQTLRNQKWRVPKEAIIQKYKLTLSIVAIKA